MESLSRPPHRKKHSKASSSSFSRSNPYADVVLSGGDRGKFQQVEYAEIFSGSSSVPVLDLSSLSQLGGCWSSELTQSIARYHDLPVPIYKCLEPVYRTGSQLDEAELRFNTLKSKFIDIFGHVPDIYARSPGRVVASPEGEE